MLSPFTLPGECLQGPRRPALAVRPPGRGLRQRVAVEGQSGAAPCSWLTAGAQRRRRAGGQRSLAPSGLSRGPPCTRRLGSDTLWEAEGRSLALFFHGDINEW